MTMNPFILYQHSLAQADAHYFAHSYPHMIGPGEPGSRYMLLRPVMLRPVMLRPITYPPLSSDRAEAYYEQYATEQMSFFSDPLEDVPDYILDEGTTVTVIDPETVSAENIARHASASTDEPPLSAEPAPPPQPPINAEFILHLLLKRDEQDTFIGDLIEDYGRKYERLGHVRANIWFYWEVGRSIWPLIKRAFLKTSVLIALGEWIRRHIS